ncbi:MAG TPA: hypothetical protein VEA80_07460 [Vitreimonas sp.]|uniref:hypothetical protein n=1 Tax=Vitreimonas sp. TaxID=3069702 RepID=UPI002D6B0B7D|nr:hypothetical protein [Vitreimonas sp.]HYD87295.1 hypothetical protein [Vitreimonas sp.]
MQDVGFAVGTGRCGTKFLAEVFARDPSVASHHERHAFSDTFHRYCRWYGIDADEAGFVATKRSAIEQDLRTHLYSFEASAFLSLSLNVLHEKLGANVVAMVRRPDKVVASYLRKGWYASEPHLDDPDKPPTMQDVTMPHHFLGRTMPRGAEFARWSRLTRVGKLAWYWSTLNRALLEQAEKLPRGAVLVQKLEELDYARFRQVADFLDAPQNVTETEFTLVRTRRPNASEAMRTPHVWTEVERREFEAEVREVAESFGYRWRIEELTREPPPRAANPSLLKQARHVLGDVLPWARPERAHEQRPN